MSFFPRQADGEQQLWGGGGVFLEEEEEEEGAVGGGEGEARQGFLSDRLQRLGEGVVLVAGEGAGVPADEDTGSVFLRGQRQDDWQAMYCGGGGGDQLRGLLTWTDRLGR